MLFFRRVAALGALALGVWLAWAGARTFVVGRVTTPRQQFGASFGDDYFLATYTQLAEYWQTLDRESDRLSLVDIGRTEEGRTQWMAVITAPENQRHLDRYRTIARRLARAGDLSDAEARVMAAEGKAVVWIDGGLHANEVLGAQQLGELVYQLVSRDDEETQRILRDVIVLAVDANPDGHELVAGWYMRQPDPARRSLAGVPRLYQKYAGHDNNRDFFMGTQAETRNINRVLYQQWFPQIVYDHHQPGPPGTVMFAPPFRDPFNYVFDPLIRTSIDLVAGVMQQRFLDEGLAGVTTRGSDYSAWWNGGLRTTAYFHNQIGLLTETIGDPTPFRIPYEADRQQPSPDLPRPITPQLWHFRRSVDYSMTANRAVLDAASRYRETLLLNAYRMARNAIDGGSRDSWSADARAVARLRAGGASAAVPEDPRDPSLRDARAYIVPSDQADPMTAARFIEALRGAGVDVLRATAPFTAAAKRYPAGSWVVRTAQAFRPHVIDMFEPQVHPDDSPSPGAPPTPPYDSAGWTLAFQMGVTVERVLDAVEGPFEPLVRPAAPVPAVFSGVADPRGFVVDHAQTDTFVALNRLLRAGHKVFWLHAGSGTGVPNTEGAWFVPAAPDATSILRTLAEERGLRVTGVTTGAPGDAVPLRAPRIGLWDRYGGSPESGWVRWMLERFEFPFERVYAQRLDAGGLASQFDVIIFPDGAIPVPGHALPGDDRPPPAALPPEFRPFTGSVTTARTVPQLRAFVEEGGTLIAIGSSTAIAAHLGLPVTNALVDPRSPLSNRPLGADAFFVPGSLLRVDVDPAEPIGAGLPRNVDVVFDNSPVFAVPAEARRLGVRPIAVFGSSMPLRSGWARGQEYLRGGVAVLDAAVGRGHVVLSGPDITFRGQSQGTFKFLFNALFAGLLERPVP